MAKQKYQTMHKAHASRTSRTSASKTYSSRPPMRIKPRRSFTWAEWTLAGIIAVCAICVGVTVFADSQFDPERDANEALAKLANEYYIEHLYPNTLGTKINDPSSVLVKFANNGLPTVRLRQLLLYNDEKRSTYSKFFSNEYYSCDTNLTTLRYFPYEPYGPRDYTVEFMPVCERSQNLAK